MIARSETVPGSRDPGRRYLTRLLLIFVLGAALLPGYIEAFPASVFADSYGRWQAQLAFVQSPAPYPEILIAGDSRAHAALLPERLGPGARSIALSGATAIETYFLLRRYLEKHPAPRTLLLSVSPYHLENADSFWRRTIKWKALRAGEVLEVFRRTGELGDPVLGEPDPRSLALRWARLRLNYVGDYAAELRNASRELRWLRNRREFEEVEAAGGHAYYGRDPGSSAPNREATDEDGFQPSPLLGAYLRDLLELASRREVRVVFAAMPVNRGSWRAMDPRYRDDYHRHLVKLAGEHPGAEFRGFLWTLPDDHFGDSSHVNERGAALVTDWLAPLL